jgi:hypothetical protein
VGIRLSGKVSSAAHFLGLEPSISLILYVHVLIIACPGCNFPVIIGRLNEKDSLEIGDEALRINCSYCGLASGASAADAKRHLVEEWPEQ